MYLANEVLKVENKLDHDVNINEPNLQKSKKHFTDKVTEISNNKVDLCISTFDIDQSLLDGMMIIDNESNTKVQQSLNDRFGVMPNHLELPSFEQTARNLYKDLDTKPLSEWSKREIAMAISKIAQD